MTDTLTRLFDPQPWRLDAACRGMDTAVFFPGQGESTAAALQTCASCPVRTECHDAGATERFGIWGGRSERTRKRSGRTRLAPDLPAAAVCVCGYSALDLPRLSVHGANRHGWGRLPAPPRLVNADRRALAERMACGRSTVTSWIRDGVPRAIAGHVAAALGATVYDLWPDFDRQERSA